MRDYDFYYTQDGSVGLYSHKDEDVYHSKFGALSEAWEKFVLPAHPEKLLNIKPEVKVLDLCYGVGYNTKALMTYIINENIKNIKKEKNKNNFLKNLKKIFSKKSKIKNNIETIDTNNNSFINKELLTYNETIHEDVVSKFSIDCLDINEDLMKISPLLKTAITPQEIFTRIVPKIFDCFDTYWNIRKYLQKNSLNFGLKNNKDITELLNLKFGDEYELPDKDYRIHKFVNYILTDELAKHFQKDFINADVKNIIKDKALRQYFDKSMLTYAKYKHNLLYKFISRVNLFAFLHNIYYDHLSRRYKNAKFKDFNSLFKLNFMVGDARKTLLTKNVQYDLIFLDAFSFSKAPELWSFEFISELVNRLAPNGLIITYSNSALVRNTFLENNLYVGKIVNQKNEKSIGTVASKEKNMIDFPLTNYEIGLCNTKAGIPYHDYNLVSTREDILKQRENDFKTSDLNTSSKFFKDRGRKGE